MTACKLSVPSVPGFAGTKLGIKKRPTMAWSDLVMIW